MLAQPFLLQVDVFLGISSGGIPWVIHERQVLCISGSAGRRCGRHGGVTGMQVHRSWWVARAAIIDARRGDGRATLTLKDGTEAPVSRTYAAELRRRGWI